MQEIFNDTTKNLPSLAQSYGSIMQNISETARALRIKFLEDGTIVTVPEISLDVAKTKSLCAIDGASGSEKMQSADILIAGSTLHEGLNAKPIFGQAESDITKPYASYSDVRLHASKNDQILSAMRAFTEIAVLGESEHDISIIDGAYLGNFLTVLYQLQDSQFTAERIIEHMQADTNKSFLRGVRKILDVKAQVASGQSIVALAKSDSSREMVRRYVGKSDFFATDKMLAEYLLKPGEMLLPAPVRANKDKVSLLEKAPQTGLWVGFKWNAKKVLGDSEYKVLEDFFDGINKVSDKDLFSLYTYLYDLNSYHYTYFKPTKFREGSNPLRVEFVADAESSADFTEHLNKKALEIASHINSDIISPTFKEPYAQYMVDRDVKQPVSSALKYFRVKLSQELKDSGLHIDGVTSGYRT